MPLFVARAAAISRWLPPDDEVYYNLTPNGYRAHIYYTYSVSTYMIFIMKLTLYEFRLHLCIKEFLFKEIN